MTLQRKRLIALQQLVVDIENRLDVLDRLSPSYDRLDLLVSKQATAPVCHFDDPRSKLHVQASSSFVHAPPVQVIMR